MTKVVQALSWVLNIMLWMRKISAQATENEQMQWYIHSNISDIDEAYAQY